MRAYNRPFMLRRPSVLFVLGAFVLAFLHASLWSAITPLWQTNDEFAHFEVAALTARLGRPVGPSDVDAALQARILTSMWDNRYWEFVGLERPERPPTRFISGDPPLPAAAWPSSWVVNDMLLGHYGGLNNTGQPLYYLALAPIGRMTAGLSIDDQLRAFRLGSRILFALAVAVIARAGWVLFGGNRPLTVAVIACAGLQPMFAYIGAGLNNDNGVALAGAIVCLLLAGGWRSGFGWKRLLALALACAAAMLTKRTAVFLLVWVVFVGAMRLMATVGVAKRIKFFTIATGIALAGIALVAWLYAIPGQLPAGWFAPPGPPAWTAKTSHSGTRAFSSGLAGASLVAATMQVSQNPQITSSVTVEAWMNGGAGLLRVLDDTGQFTEQPFPGSTEWRLISVTHPSGGLFRIAIVLVGLETDPMNVDDIRVTGNEGTPIGVPNASAEQIVPALGDVVLWAGRAMGVLGQAQVLVRDYRANLAALPARLDLAARMMTASYWGRFGNFVRRDNPGIALDAILPFAALAAVSLISLLAQLVLRRRSDISSSTLLIWLVGVALLVAQTLAPLLSFSSGGIWLPQGRYLFGGMGVLAPLCAIAWVAPLRGRWRWMAVAVIGFLLALFSGWCALQSFAYYSI